MKALRLLVAALLTFFVCATAFYIFDRDRFLWNYRCWRQAVTWASCVRGGHFDFEADLNGARYRGNTGNYIDSHIFFYGAFEKPILFFLRDVMKSAYSNQGVFLDIGANTGQHSLFMARYSKEIHAFEPWQPVLRRFRRMVEINRIKNIVIHPYGLGDENSKKPFYKPPDNNPATGSFVAGFIGSNSYEGELELQIGDNALEKASISSVALIKMDIEGYEKPALKGLRGTLQKNRPIVMFEMTMNPRLPVRIKSNAEMVGLFPEKYEFLVFTQPEDEYTGAYTLKPSEAVVQFDKYEVYNIVAYPLEKKAYLPRRRPS